jgi:hypothetical protein
MSKISDAFRLLFTSEQKDGESLQDYTRRFKTSTEILESHLGGLLRKARMLDKLRHLNIIEGFGIDGMGSG